MPDFQEKQHGEWFVCDVSQYQAFRANIKAEIAAMQPAPVTPIVTLPPQVAPIVPTLPTPTPQPTELMGVDQSGREAFEKLRKVEGPNQPDLWAQGGFSRDGQCVAAVKDTGERCTGIARSAPWCGRHTQSARKGSMVPHPGSKLGFMGYKQPEVQVSPAPVAVPQLSPTAQDYSTAINEQARLLAEIERLKGQLVQQLPAATPIVAAPPPAVAEPQVNGAFARLSKLMGGGN